MIKRTLLLLNLAMLFAPILNGQTLRGQVRDSANAAIPFASIVATGCTDQRVLGFSTSDEQGSFVLTVPATCDSVIFTTRALGFRPAERRFALRDLPARHDFVLDAIGMPLREVVVRAETPPIVVRNDTTEFNVASFSDSTEFSVEDLVRKLPGARVSETGVITLNGKTVERVLIEGDDLFGNNYALATRNVRADMVSKIQAIDRFEDNPMMRGIRESDRLVLNLKFKEEKKRAQSGSIMAGSGYGDEWKAYGHSNLFSLSRRDKIYVITNANNTGENSLGDAEYLDREAMPGKNTQSIQASPLEPQDLIDAPQPESAGLPAAFESINRTGLLYAGYVLPLRPNAKIRLAGWLGQEQLWQQSGAVSRYRLDSGFYQLNEDRSFYRRLSVRQLRLEADWFSADRRHGFRLFARSGANTHRYTLGWLRTNNLFPGEGSRIETTNPAQRNEHYGSLEYSFKPSENTLIQLSGRSGWLRNRQELFSDYEAYAPFFQFDSTYTHLAQQARPTQWAGSLAARILLARGNWQHALETGFALRDHALHSEIAVSNPAGERQLIAGEEYRNDFHWHIPRYYAALSTSRQFGSLRIRAGLTGAFLPLSYHLGAGMPSRFRRSALEPTLSLRYNPTELITWTAFYRFEQALPQTNELQPAYIFTDYQTLMRGRPDFSWINTHHAGAAWRIQNPRRHFAANVSLNLLRGQNGYGTDLQLDPFLMRLDRFRPVRTRQYSLRWGADRYFRTIQSRFELGGGWLVQQREDKLNSDAPLFFGTRQFTLQMGYGTAFDGWVNGLLNARFSHTTTTREGEAPALPGVSSWFSSLQVVVKPSPRFYLKTLLYRAANRGGGLPSQVYYAAEATGSWQLPRWHSQVQLSGVNLLGTRRYEQASADGFTQYSSFITAVRPFFLLTWEWSF